MNNNKANQIIGELRLLRDLHVIFLTDNAKIQKKLLAMAAELEAQSERLAKLLKELE